jgi:hypothetical protein
MTPIARRVAVIAYGAALLVWLSLEDSGSLSPPLLGTAGAVLLLTRTARPRSMVVWLLRGAGGGAVAVLIAALLMLLKTGWHAHLVPDYPLSMIVEMLARAPAWSAAGALVGLGAGMIRTGVGPDQAAQSICV